MSTLSRAARAHEAQRHPLHTTNGRTRRLPRLADWLSALLADDGMSARFDGERQRDEDLVRRVERQRRP
jgi:hypothetical protein